MFRYALRTLTACMVALLVSCLWFQPAAAQQQRKYPSTGTMWVIPGNYVAPTDQATIDLLTSLYGAATANEVRRWESEHADIAVSAYGTNTYGSYASSILCLGYKEYQTHSNGGIGDWGAGVYFQNNGYDYEEIFCHLAEDTTFNMTESQMPSTPNSAMGAFNVIVKFNPFDFVNTSNAAKGSLAPVDLFGGSLYLGLRTRFDEVIITLSRAGEGGAVVYEYPTALDAEGSVTGWTALTVISDGTNGFRQSGTMRFRAPANWAFGHAKNVLGVSGDLGTAKRYWIRVRKVTEFTTRPLFTGLRTRKWYDVLPDGKLKQRGWDPANDVDGDKWISPEEEANLQNTSATARFPHEARIGCVGTGGLPRDQDRSWANVWSTRLRDAYLWGVQEDYNRFGIMGYYNDNAMMFPDPSWYPVVSGGTVRECPDPLAKLNTTAFRQAYSYAWTEIHGYIKQQLPNFWIGANITNSKPGLFTGFHPQYPQKFNWYLMEGFISENSGLLFGLFQRWDVQHYTALGLKVGVMLHVKDIPYYFGHTQRWWERSLEALLVQYYLIHVPGMTYFNSWRAGYTYGSGLTGTSDFWKAGVPRNMAYQPTKMLEVDIGEPANMIPGSYTPIPYVSMYGSGEDPRSDSTRTSITDPSLGTLPLTPTYTFVLYPVPYSHAARPPEIVVARKFTKGLVVWRSQRIPNCRDLNYLNSHLTVQLPGGPYRRVNYDGTLGPPITEITLGGNEGAILVDAAQSSVPNIQLTMSVDKPNPKPLEVVTVTIEARNTGSTEARDAEIRLPLPSNTVYEQGSLVPQDLRADTSQRSVLKIGLPTLPPGGRITIQLRLITH